MSPFSGMSTELAAPERQTAAHEAYGEQELLLGVAANRETQRLLAPAAPTAAYFSTAGEVVHIDIQNDPVLFSFLSDIKNTVMSSKPPTLHDIALGAANAVVASTIPDETGAFHQRRNLTLGEALRSPVECIDRALAMEAVFKMFGIHDAQMLIGADALPNSTRVNHADVAFSIDEASYVAITMGTLAGEVMTKETYVDQYLPWREAVGLGTRTLKETWSYPYFETIDPTY